MRGRPYDGLGAAQKGVGEKGKHRIDDTFRNRKHVRDVEIQDKRRRIRALELELENEGGIPHRISTGPRWET